MQAFCANLHKLLTRVRGWFWSNRQRLYFAVHSRGVGFTRVFIHGDDLHCDCTLAESHGESVAWLDISACLNCAAVYGYAPAVAGLVCNRAAFYEPGNLALWKVLSIQKSGVKIFGIQPGRQLGENELHAVWAV